MEEEKNQKQKFEKIKLHVKPFKIGEKEGEELVFTNKTTEQVGREALIEFMKAEIEIACSEYDFVVILENNKVIDILEIGKGDRYDGEKDE